MPRNSSGVYTVPAGTPAVTLQTISSSAYNNFLNDISAAITQSLATTGTTGGATMSQALNMSNNKITGLAGPPVATTDAANKIYVDAESQFGGFVNRLRNSNFKIWQRGQSVTAGNGAGPVYTSDGWLVAATGANAVAQYQASPYSMQLNGAAGMTQVLVMQRVESSYAFSLANARCTFQAYVFNNTSSSITPVVYIQHPNTMDNWAVANTDYTANLQTCATGVWTTLAYSFQGPSNGYLGLQAALAFGALTSGNVLITNADMRLTPGAVAGLNPTPPPVELRDIKSDLAFCQRYFETSYDLGVAPGTASAGGGAAQFYLNGLPSAAYTGGVQVLHKVSKRVAPTVTLYSTSTGAAGKIYDGLGATDVTGSVAAIGQNGFLFYGANSASRTGIQLLGHYAASAEL